jgi:hypothetical protein
MTKQFKWYRSHIVEDAAKVLGFGDSEPKESGARASELLRAEIEVNRAKKKSKERNFWTAGRDLHEKYRQPDDLHDALL